MISEDNIRIAIVNTYHSYTIILKEVIKRTRPDLIDHVDIIDQLKDLNDEYEYIFCDTENLSEEFLPIFYKLIENNRSVFILYSYHEENPWKIEKENVYYFYKEADFQSIVNVVREAFLKKPS